MQTDLAASSPALSNNSVDTGTTSLSGVPKVIHFTTADATALTPHQRLDSLKNRRGHNKPTCVKCGNVARSKCPFNSCKSCCAKEQNPCPIHVVKSSATSAEKTVAASSPLPGRRPSESSPSGNMQRFASLRQLSSSFSQFSNVQAPIHLKKSITRKEAATINEWRFSKLKEFTERNSEMEDEAFERYMRNASLLEEIFHMESEFPPERLRPTRSDTCGQRIQGVMNLGKNEVRDEVDGGSDELGRNKKQKVFDELLEKMNKARNEEDLQSCIKMKEEIFEKQVDEGVENVESSSVYRGNLNCSMPTKMVATSQVDQESLVAIDRYFDSLDHIEDL